MEGGEELPVSPAEQAPPSEPAAGSADDGGPGEGAAAAAAAGPPLSKNARKKLEKAALRETRQREKKSQKREAEKEASALRLAAIREKTAALSPEELEQLAERRAVAVAERKRRGGEEKSRRAAALASPFSVVVDCSFGHLMETKEKNSLAAQFQHSYSANARAALPCRLCFTGLTGELAEGLARHAGSEHWPVVRCEESYLQLFAERRSSLVYLTADSEVELDELRAEDV